MADTYVIQPCLAFFRILGRMEFLEPMFWAMPTWRVTGTHASMFTLRWRTFRRSHKLQSYWGNKNPMQTVQKINNNLLQGGPSNIEIQRCICPSYIETAVSTNNTSGKYYFKYKWNTFSIFYFVIFFFFILWWSILSISFFLPYLTCL